MIRLLIFAEIALAQVTKTNLFRKEPAAATASSEKSHELITGSVKKTESRKSVVVSEVGNLPRYFFGRDTQVARFSENPVILPSSARKAQLASLPLGSVVSAEIVDGIVAFPEAKVPIRAVVRSGPMKGTIFLGEATLERNSKRVTIEFRKLRAQSRSDVYSTLANALDFQGLLGIEGEHHSGEAKYFGAEFAAAAAAAAGFVDASVERNQNILGQVAETASVANATRKAFSNALMRTADRFAEKVRAAPEYVVVRGPIRIQILIQEQPKLQE